MILKEQNFKTVLKTIPGFDWMNIKIKCSKCGNAHEGDPFEFNASPCEDCESELFDIEAK